MAKRAKIYDGSAWQDIATAVPDLSSYQTVANTGLQLVKKQTIGTAVSSVSVTDCFNANYENYKVIVMGGTASQSNDFTFQFTGVTTGYYSQLTYGTYGSNSAPATVSSSNGSGWIWCGAYGSNFQRLSLEIFSPFSTQVKTALGDYNAANTSGSNGTSRFWCSSTASCTGLTLTTQGGTITGGTIYVYGYQK
jgi:hypothetical protein